jgi:2-hydroxychromene-2-carboxylate isomerase
MGEEMSEDTAPFQFSAPLTVCVDLKIPQCFLALEPTLELAHELQVAIDWQPVVLAPLVEPPAAGPEDPRGARHRNIRALYEANDIARYAQVRGLTIANIYRTTDTSLAGMALSFVKRVEEAELTARFLTELFTRFWSENFSAEAVGAMSDLLAGVGADANGFASYASGEGPAAFEALQAGLKAAGIFAAPTYVVDEEPFVGRQHLPMIRWLLTGKAGPAPV